ncbi:hypothetical protein BX666DRAFT_1886644 [Dichotomocladium elegans]|nr:hypothetical protein BX666DRAFT_1886644 [Dichotomocladium elegans]
MAFNGGPSILLRTRSAAPSILYSPCTYDSCRALQPDFLMFWEICTLTISPSPFPTFCICRMTQNRVVTLIFVSTLLSRHRRALHRAVSFHRTTATPRRHRPCLFSSWLATQTCRTLHSGPNQHRARKTGWEQSVQTCSSLRQEAAAVVATTITRSLKNGWNVLSSAPRPSSPHHQFLLQSPPPPPPPPHPPQPLPHPPLGIQTTITFPVHHPHSVSISSRVRNPFHRPSSSAMTLLPPRKNLLQPHSSVDGKKPWLTHLAHHSPPHLKKPLLPILHTHYPVPTLRIPHIMSFLLATL